MLIGGDLNAQLGANDELDAIERHSFGAAQLRTGLRHWASPAPVDTGKHVLGKTRIHQRKIPLNKAPQTTRLHIHEQILVQTLQRRRNIGTDRHEQRSQGSDRWK